MVSFCFSFCYQKASKHNCHGDKDYGVVNLTTDEYFNECENIDSLLVNVLIKLMKNKRKWQLASLFYSAAARVDGRYLLYFN